MLSGFALAPTLPTSDLAAAKAFYEGLGFTAGEESFPGATLFGAEGRQFLVYESAFAGTNQATAMAFNVPSQDFDQVIADLRAKGVTFDTFEAEGMTWEGDVMVMGEMKTVWFKDPDGNILAVNSMP